MSNYPISGKCPACGGINFKRVKSKGMVAFTDDRVCAGCGTRYTPPTPLWAGVAFIISALALPVLGFVLITLLFNPFSILGLFCEGVFILFALIVFIGGVRELIKHSEQAT
jgi:hypothetical protein